MSTTEPRIRTERKRDSPTRLEIDITGTSTAELREFVNSRQKPVHLERRGRRTFLITETE